VVKSVFTSKYDRFRRLLIDARREAGLTQSELARQLDRPQSYISKYERGERRVDVVEFLDIARALDINVHRFLKMLDDRKRS